MVWRSSVTVKVQSRCLQASQLIVAISILTSTIIMWKYVKGVTKNGEILLHYIPSPEMVADMLTASGSHQTGSVARLVCPCESMVKLRQVIKGWCWILRSIVLDRVSVSVIKYYFHKTDCTATMRYDIFMCQMQQCVSEGTIILCDGSNYRKRKIILFLTQKVYMIWHQRFVWS